MTKYHRVSGAVVLLAVLCAAGCTSDDPAQPTDLAGVVRGSVTYYHSGEPVDGAVALLVDATTLAGVAGPVLIGVDGAYEFTGMAAGEYHLFLSYGSFVVFDRTTPTVVLEAEQVVDYDVRMIYPGNHPSYHFRIAGTVTDAITKAPISGAFVSCNASAPWDVQFPIRGIFDSDWTITDPDGRFGIQSSAFRTELGAICVLPISCSKAGYRPTSLVGTCYDFPNWGGALPAPTGEDSTLVVSLQLEPLPAGGTGTSGALAGRLVHLGAPLAAVDVAVSLMCRADPDTFVPEVVVPDSPKVHIPERIATTGADGEFLIAGLDAGVYCLAPAFHLDDGYGAVNYYLTDEVYAVAEGDTLDMGDIEVFTSVQVVRPAHGATISTSYPVLEWEPVPGASHYRLLISIDQRLAQRYIEHDTATSYQIPEDEPIPEGSCVRWMVIAVAPHPESGDPIYVGFFEDSATFCIE